VVIDVKNRTWFALTNFYFLVSRSYYIFYLNSVSVLLLNYSDDEIIFSNSKSDTNVVHGVKTANSVHDSVFAARVMSTAFVFHDGVP